MEEAIEKLFAMEELDAVSLSYAHTVSAQQKADLEAFRAASFGLTVFLSLYFGLAVLLSLSVFSFGLAVFLFWAGSLSLTLSIYLSGLPFLLVLFFQPFFPNASL